MGGYDNEMLRHRSIHSNAAITSARTDRFDRENFIRDVNKICLEQQRASSANTNYPDAMLAFYCDSLASLVANTISPAELHSPTLQEKANVAVHGPGHKSISAARPTDSPIVEVWPKKSDFHTSITCGRLRRR